jgi:hypothetical protein
MISSDEYEEKRRNILEQIKSAKGGSEDAAAYILFFTLRIEILKTSLIYKHFFGLPDTG